MMRQALTAAILLVLLTLLTGAVYPLAMTGLAQALFPGQASGSLIVRQGAVVGSKLIGQKFTGPEYFRSRPSAAGPDGYDAASSSGSNLGPTNDKLLASVEENAKKVRTDNRLSANAPVPSDLVTASGSGLDPDISPAAAYLQAGRIAMTRGLAPEMVRGLVDGHVQRRQLGLFGEPRVNVLVLNLALDALKNAE